MSQAQIERRLATHAKVAKKISLFTRVAAQKQFTPPPGRMTVGSHSYAIKPSVAEFSPASQWELLDDDGSVDGQLFVGGNATLTAQSDTSSSVASSRVSMERSAPVQVAAVVSISSAQDTANSNVIRILESRRRNAEREERTTLPINNLAEAKRLQ